MIWQINLVPFISEAIRESMNLNSTSTNYIFSPITAHLTLLYVSNPTAILRQRQGQAVRHVHHRRGSLRNRNFILRNLSFLSFQPHPNLATPYSQI